MSELAVVVWTRELAEREKSLREAADNLGMKNTRNEDMGKVLAYLNQQVADYLVVEMELAEAEHNVAFRKASANKGKLTKAQAKKPAKKKVMGAD